MGVFNDFLSARFSNLKDAETTLLTSDTHTLAVISLRITNKTDSIILINLKNIRNDGGATTTYEENAFSIQPRQRIDLVKERGNEFHLQYTADPAVNEILKVFSNGYNQIFDCNISYIKFNN